MSEIYVDTIRVNDKEGYSFRTAEAIILNRKIISNRKTLVKEKFYSKERVFLIGIDSVDNLKHFLENEISPLPQNILQFYDSQLWWTEHDPWYKIDQNSRLKIFS